MPAAVRPPRRRTLLRVVGYLLAWLVVALPAWLIVFFHSQAPMVVASHDARVSPTLDQHSRIEMGPYLPDFRLRNDQLIGVDIDFGKTNASSAGELVRRYSVLASRPEPEIRRIRQEVVGLAWDSAFRGAVIGLVPIALWLLLGPRRRAELGRPSPSRALVVSTAFGLAALAVIEPWQDAPHQVTERDWIPLRQAIPELQVPEELAHVEVQGGLLTSATRRLISSAFDSFQKSTKFFEKIEDKADTIAGQLRRPESDEITAVLVSDRHDNISMDAVVRRVADLAGATVILDAGDDTSTGEPWEAFSLDSLDEAFDDYTARVAVAGNHDNGPFVSQYLKDLGWTHLEGDPVKPFGDVRFFGVDDPRTSGLGSWRDQAGPLSFDEVRERIADETCDLGADGRRVATLLVHDANLGREALARGCVDLVLAGHLHRQVGPTRVVGENGKIGYSYTNGTTGGAAYAIALASKLRRQAEFTFVTYRDGRPIGLQPVKISPAGEFTVAPYIELDFKAPTVVSPLKPPAGRTG
ncbi:MAG TPA: metallophosphoesterase [Marmoricola sp.]|nr:metallophosphoesterase [Marmoricola sp.]